MVSPLCAVPKLVKEGGNGHRSGFNVAVGTSLPLWEGGCCCCLKPAASYSDGLNLVAFLRLPHDGKRTQERCKIPALGWPFRTHQATGIPLVVLLYLAFVLRRDAVRSLSYFLSGSAFTPPASCLKPVCRHSCSYADGSLTALAHIWTAERKNWITKIDCVLMIGRWTVQHLVSKNVIEIAKKYKKRSEALKCN